MIILSILFFVTALIYSSVGFGGGSTYLALLILWGIPYQIFPVIALACNIICSEVELLSFLITILAVVFSISSFESVCFILSLSVTKTTR